MCALLVLSKIFREVGKHRSKSCSCSIHVDGQSAHCPRRLRLHRFPTRSANLLPTSLSLLSHLPSFSIAAGGILAPRMVPCSLLWPQPPPSHHASASSSSPVSPPLWCSAAPLLARPRNPSPALGLVAGCSDDGAPPTALPRGSCREAVRLRVRGLRLAGRWQP
jgi:hypothetical protein